MELVYLVSFVLTVTGAFVIYVAVGLARTSERKRCFEECEERLAEQRRAMKWMRQLG